MSPSETSNWDIEELKKTRPSDKQIVTVGWWVLCDGEKRFLMHIKEQAQELCMLLKALEERDDDN